MLAASNAGILHAIDLRSGRDRWTFDGGGSYGIDLTTKPVALKDGTILWPGPRDTLFGLSADGRERWRVKLDGLVLTPAVRDGTAYVATLAGTVAALDLGEGSPHERWRRHFEGPTYAAPALGPGGLVVSSSGNDVLALHDDGTTAWRVATRGLVEVSGAVAADGTTIIGSNDGTQYGIDRVGRVRWRYRIGELTYASTVITADGLAYFGDHGGFVNAVNVATGRLVFRVRGRARDAAERNIGVWTTPVVDAQHAVYAGDHTGHLRGFASNGALLFDLDLGDVLDSALALAPDGALLAGSESGALVAVADR